MKTPKIDAGPFECPRGGDDQEVGETFAILGILLCALLCVVAEKP